MWLYLVVALAHVERGEKVHTHTLYLCDDLFIDDILIMWQIVTCWPWFQIIDKTSGGKQCNDQAAGFPWLPSSIHCDLSHVYDAMRATVWLFSSWKSAKIKLCIIQIAYESRTHYYSQSSTNLCCTSLKKSYKTYILFYWIFQNLLGNFIAKLTIELLKCFFFFFFWDGVIQFEIVVHYLITNSPIFTKWF